MGGEALEQVAQGSCDRHIPGGAQGQIGWDSEQLDPAEDVPAHSRGVKWDDLKSPCPTPKSL